MSLSLRVDSSPLIAGALVVGSCGLGVLADSIPSTGDSGPSFLYNDISLPSDAGKEVRGLITSWPVSGALFAWEDGSFTYSGPSGSFSYQLYVDGAAVGAPVAVSLTVGAAAINGAAPGAVLAGAGAISSGAAVGGSSSSGTAPGASLSGGGAVSVGGAAGGSASSSGVGPGAVLSGDGALAAGGATGGGASSGAAPGQVLTGAGGLSAGGASGVWAPTDGSEPISLAEIKAHLRIDADITEHDPILMILIAAARAQAEQRIGRRIGLQDAQLVLNGFPRGSIRLPYPPVYEVLSVVYDDPDGGAEVELSKDAYRVRLSCEPAVISPVAGWPATLQEPGAVRIHYRCGVTPSDRRWVGLRAWLLLAVGFWFVDAEGGVSDLPDAFWDGLLDPLCFFGTVTLR